MAGSHSMALRMAGSGVVVGHSRANQSAAEGLGGVVAGRGLYLAGLICHTRAMSTATATKIFADRINRIEVSATMAITAAALKLKSEGVNLADFGAGEPHFSTPRHIKDAAIEAIEKNFTRYTNVAGIPEVRKAIVDRHACDFGSNYAPDECVFTAGGKILGGHFTNVLVLQDATPSESNPCCSH